jgi:hypothetical protein
MIGTWASAPQDLQLLKQDIIDATGLGKDALHIYAGLAIFMIVRLTWRRRGGWWLAWIAALALAAGVEWLDMRVLAAGAGIMPDAGHWHDIWNTMFWPTVLLLVGRWLQPHAKYRPGSGDRADQPFEQSPPV